MSTLDTLASALLDVDAPTPDAILGDVRIDATRRWSVHRNTVASTLVDALVDSFPVTHALIGDDLFRAMAHARVVADPPRSPVLTRYADGFADFIDTFEPAREMPWLSDVARIEALRIQSYHAADAAPLPQAAFADLLASGDALADTRVRLHPALRWLRTPNAAFDLWHAHHGVDAADVDLDGIDPDRPQAVLVTRPMFDVDLIEIPHATAHWLDALHAGATLGEAFAAVDIGAIDPATLFAVLVRPGVATAFHSDGDIA